MLLLFLTLSVISFAQKGPILVVDADKPISKIQPTLWGIFFEDINFAADGGIYAELVKNRSFEFTNPKEGWVFEGAFMSDSPVLILNRGEENINNPRIAQVTINGKTCITNEGFRGMGIRQDNEYRFSLLASLKSGQIKVSVKLIGSDGSEIGSTFINPADKSWKKYESIIKATKTDSKASLKLCFEGDGRVQIDMVSLFPVNTWKNRSNGLRADIVQKLADLKPGFIRFPGGCIVEGRDLAKRYQWKYTIGNLEERKLIINRWNDENARATPDYFQSFGLGFYEYFQLAEDIGAEPLPILNCGMACQFNTAELVPLEQLDSFIEDALDLIEFANGAATTPWGKIRAGMGHPESFNMKYLGIGNEQWGPQYFERYALFEKALKEKHPEIMLVSSAGPMPSGPMFDQAGKELRKYNPALVDEHFYNTTQWFFNNATRYDNYERNSYKIFAGEYAARNGMQGGKGEIKSTWEAALAEAALMTGIERNADVVYMASYAPLLANTEAFQWSPNLIWFDNLKTFGTPSYYVQKMFSTNKGTELLRITKDGKALTGDDGLYATVCRDENTKEIIMKLVNKNAQATKVDIRINSKEKGATTAKRIVMQSDDLTLNNSIDKPESIIPVEDEFKTGRGIWSLPLKAYSLTILRLRQN